MWQLLFNFFFYAFCYNMCKFEGRQKLPAFVGKPGDKVTYEVKVINCTSDGADPTYDSGNLKFDVVVKSGEIQVTIDIAAKTITVN